MKGLKGQRTSAAPIHAHELLTLPSDGDEVWTTTTATSYRLEGLEASLVLGAVPIAVCGNFNL